MEFEKIEATYHDRVRLLKKIGYEIDQDGDWVYPGKNHTPYISSEQVDNCTNESFEALYDKCVQFVNTLKPVVDEVVSQEAKVIIMSGNLFNEFQKVEGLQSVDKHSVCELIHRIQDMMYANLYIQKHGRI